MIPLISKFEVPTNVVLIDSFGEILGPPVKVDSGRVTDADNGTDEDRLLRHGVILYEPATGTKYVGAGDSTRKAWQPAVVTSQEAPDSDWASKVVTAKVNGKSVSVTLGGSDDTIGEVVTALAANTTLAGMATPSDSGADDLLVMTSREKGKHVLLEVSISTIETAFGTAGLKARGSDPKVLVLRGTADGKFDNAILADNFGQTKDAMVRTWLSGHFYQANLIVPNDDDDGQYLEEALFFLERQGARFD